MPRPLAVLISPPRRRGACGQLSAFLLAAAIGGCAHNSARAITIQFDYSYDGLGFFGTAANPTPARTTLEFAARSFTSFTDTLAPIVPGGQNGWTASFLDPSTGSLVHIPNLQVPGNTLIVYAIARDLTGSALGQASPGIHSFIGTPTVAFSNAVANRNQGSALNDFAPWGGVIAFDVRNSNNEARNWHYDFAAAPPSNAYDFHTVATHELAHLFGFGTSAAFTADVANKQFVGAVTQTLYGGPVPMYAPNDQASQHWDVGVTSPPFLLGTRPKPSLGPLLSLGERRLITPLDYAALADVGWQVPAKLLELPADFNRDGAVDGSDFLIWQRSFGGSGVNGDANGDGLTDNYDAWMLRQYFGAIGQGSQLANAPVPEPPVALLVIASLMAFVPLSRTASRRTGIPRSHVTRSQKSRLEHHEGGDRGVLQPSDRDEDDRAQNDLYQRNCERREGSRLQGDRDHDAGRQRRDEILRRHPVSGVGDLQH